MDHIIDKVWEYIDEIDYWDDEPKLWVEAESDTVVLGEKGKEYPGECKQVSEFIRKDEAGKMNVNPLDAGAELLIVSQFTLYADCKSRRPGFTRAARPETAIPLYELVVQECRDRGFTVGTGVFGAEMQVFSQNDGPVTILLDTEKL